MTATRTLQFTKMHGAGNDFVVLDATTQELPALEAFARQLCDRHRGIGADQLLIVRPAEDTTQADFRMDIYNPDGSQVEMCANGIRAFFKYLRDRDRIEEDEIRVETLSGVVRPRWMGENRIRVDMGRPILQPAKIPTTLGTGDGPVLDVDLEVSGQTVRLSSVSMGNPHAVIEVPHVDTAPVKQLGSAIENHPAFPNRVNVEFIEVVDRELIRQRTWERGTGETLACGSGACAVAVTAMLRDRTDRAVRVQLRGGELEIQWAGEDQSVFMTGPAIEVFEGQISFEGE
jgi:diaminopimelate epimerase